MDSNLNMRASSTIMESRGANLMNSSSQNPTKQEINEERIDINDSGMTRPVTVDTSRIPHLKNSSQTILPSTTSTSKSQCLNVGTNPSNSYSLLNNPTIPSELQPYIGWRSQDTIQTFFTTQRKQENGRLSISRQKE